MVKLFVSGFPLEITELELAKLIGIYGDISTIKIVRDKKTRICKGYAFIEMVTEQSAKNAVEALNGTPMEDRELTVKISEEKPVIVSKPSFNPSLRKPFSPAIASRPAGERPKRPRKQF
jgi:RNA recognition motif-containing protein